MAEDETIVLDEVGRHTWTSEPQDLDPATIGESVVEYRVVGGRAELGHIEDRIEATESGVVVHVDYEVVVADPNSNLEIIRVAVSETPDEEEREQ